MANKEKKNQPNYISRRESAEISRRNRRITDEIEKQRNRKHVDPSEYMTVMHNPENVVEFDNLHTPAKNILILISRTSEYATFHVINF